MDSPLPFDAFPARPRRPVLGALLIVGSFVLPISLLVVNFAYAYHTTFGTPGITPVVGPHTLVGLLLVAGWVAVLLVSWRMFKVGAALRQRDAVELLKVDRRAPVLYLRSFGDDAVPDLTKPVLPLPPRQTIEMRLAQVFEGLGPVVSIGRPGERLPEAGANRFYVADDDWQRAVLYFLERAAAVVILVGHSSGVTWEIKRALETVPLRKILFVFPYLLPKEKRTVGRSIKEALRPRGQGDDSVSKAMLTDLREEHEARYQSFHEKFGDLHSPDLPPRIDGHVFLDFISDAEPRLLPTREPLFIRRRRDRQGLTLDYRRTLRPFLEKLQNRTIDPDWVERFFTNRYTLSAFTAICAILAILGFLSPFWLGFGPAGVAVFLLTAVPGNLAYWGVWNLSRYVSWKGVMKRVVAAVAGGWLGGVFGGIVYSAGMLPESPEAAIGAIIAALIDGVAGMLAGLIAGLRLRVWGWVVAATAIGVLLVLVGAWVTGLPLQSVEQLDAGDILMVAFPCLAIGSAIWGGVRARRV